MAEDPNLKDIFDGSGKVEINKCFSNEPLAPVIHPPDQAGITAVNRTPIIKIMMENKVFQHKGIGDKHLKKVKKKNSQEDNILQYIVRMHSIFIYRDLCMVSLMAMWSILSDPG